MSVSRTGHEIKWRRNLDISTALLHEVRPRTQLFLGEDAEPLFTVVTHGGPSEGVFTLINEAPRIRDEVDEMQKKLSEALDALERLYRNSLRIFDKKPVRDWGETLGEVQRVLDRYGMLDE